MKNVFASIIALLLVVLCASSAKAGPDGYQVRWTFYEFLDYHYSEYSTNMSIPLAATLPVKAVNLGWACVREPVLVVKGSTGVPGEVGAWACSNGSEIRYAFASCGTDKINSDYAQLRMTWPGVQEEVVLTASCTALGRWL